MKDVKTTAKSFRATLERGAMNLGWTMIRIPFDSAKLWGSRGQIKIKGDINGFPIRGILFPDGNGNHFLLVTKKMQKGGMVTVGATAQFRLEVDTEPRPVEMPEELAAILKEERALKKWFDQLSGSTRNWLMKWIMGATSSQARARRADQVAERMVAAMEAEHDLPPVLRIAFANDPIGYEAWKKISPSHRRNHLIAIFGYRSPQSRARRIQKMLAELRKPKSKRED
jgi:uncharacterized protein YdeI (YjbR/CyaY-like superfamily)